MSEIAALIKKIAGSGKQVNSFPAQVVSVDKDAQTCEVKRADNDLSLFDVRLTPGGEQSGYFVAYPVAGSYVLVSELGNNVFYCSLISETENFGYFAIDGLTINAGSSFKCLLNANGLVFNDGLNGGLVTIVSLIAKLNALESRMASHQHSYVSPTGPLITTPDPITNTALPVSQISDLEDTKIKH